MKQVDHAALAHHRVVVQVLLQPLPELERMAVKLRVALKAIVGAHNRRVAPHIAAAQIALFEHGDIGHPVVLGEVIGRRKPVSAAPNDDGVILGLRLGVAPMRRPALVAREAFLENFQRGKAHVSPFARRPYSGSGYKTQPLARLRLSRQTQRGSPLFDIDCPTRDCDFEICTTALQPT